MEGVVAGVPELADYDVIIDAGGDASDPENAVPFDIRTPAGKTYRQPGNFFALVETSVFGTDPKFTVRGVRADLNGDGKVVFPEALPDADFLVATARDFHQQARDLDASAHEWQPAPEDVFTAVVVMTPTMSEYFEAWKNSRFVAGDAAEEKGFVATSRLSDISDILGGLVLIYAASMIDASSDYVQHNPTYKWFGSIVSLSFWGALWAIVGLICVHHAFQHNDRFGFTAAIGIKVVWGLGSFAGWLMEDVQIGSVAIWLGLAGLVWIISGWPEPPTTSEDAPHDVRNP